MVYKKQFWEAQHSIRMKILVYGLGYVGAVTSAMLAKEGHTVLGVDNNRAKVDLINNGESPVNEPYLRSVIKEQVLSGRLTASNNTKTTDDLDAVFICVGTPSNDDGGMDDSQVRNVIAEITDLRQQINSNLAVFNRSTCLPSTHMWAVTNLKKRFLGQVEYFVHPEFLREGSALSDFKSPPLILYGSEEEVNTDLAEISKLLYPGVTSPVHVVGIKEAAVAKYASNAFHAVKVTFANEIGSISKSVGADARSILEILCCDTTLNISEAYLKPGMPYGGSCLPKDVSALVGLATGLGTTAQMLGTLNESNDNQISSICERLLAEKPESIGFLGISFKQGTDDLRGSPFVRIARCLIDKGVKVSIYDKDVDLERFTGANLTFLNSLIPELNEITFSRASEVIDNCEIVLLAHRNALHDLKLTPPKPNVKIFDLVGLSNDELSGFGDVEGLYW